MNRIDYIRATAHVPRNGVKSARGVNPYDSDFGVLPAPEIQRLLRKVRDTKGRRNFRISMSDVSREASIEIGHLYNFLYGRPTREYVGHVPLRRLSRFLMKFENGTAIKHYGRVIYREEPTKKPDIVYRVDLSGLGRPNAGPTIVPGMTPRAPRQMPKLFAQFARLGSD